ncbi:MAG: hypothetical protein IT442_04150 [Phycisphaeraceae bacterium]|nr:hypothetical protein [Phycisphaeraceae bacterium]
MPCLHRPAAAHLVLLIALLLTAPQTSAHLTVYPGPCIDPASTEAGYTANLFFTALAGNGSAINPARKIDAQGNSLGYRTIRWDTTGAVTELAPLAVSSSGLADTSVKAANNTGFVVGTSSSATVRSPVRWDASGIPTELETPGTSSSSGEAKAINIAGTAVGRAGGYPGVAFRWDAGSASATVLTGINYPTAINDAGAIAGYIYKGSLGERPVRLDPGSATAVELGHLGTSSTGYTTAKALCINQSGVIAGVALKYYNAEGTIAGLHVVRWDPGSTTPSTSALSGTILNPLSTTSPSTTQATFSAEHPPCPCPRPDPPSGKLLAP